MNDRHHILHDRRSWSVRPESLKLRNTPSLIPRIDRDVHEALHEDCPPVPTLGVYAVRNTLELFHPTGDTFRDMDSLMMAMNKGTKDPRFHPLERDLAGLAIEAIELQREWIVKGLLA
jgi:hypothetical protein